jgi:hypothetical protein
MINLICNVFPQETEERVDTIPYGVVYHDEWHIQIPGLLIAMREGKATGSSMIYVSEQDSKLLSSC